MFIYERWAMKLCAALCYFACLSLYNGSWCSLFPLLFWVYTIPPWCPQVTMVYILYQRLVLWMKPFANHRKSPNIKSNDLLAIAYHELADHNFFGNQSLYSLSEQQCSLRHVRQKINCQNSHMGARAMRLKNMNWLTTILSAISHYVACLNSNAACLRHVVRRSIARILTWGLER